VPTIVSGEMAVRGTDGTERVVRGKEAFYAGPGHDAWVRGDKPCVALDFPLAYEDAFCASTLFAGCAEGHQVGPCNGP
jgi:hypothetical protein